MSLTVRQRADTIATFRYVNQFLMETLARWVPTTPELEAKLLFGRHIWELAQHTDWLGRRTAELRAPPHWNLEPVPAVTAALHQLAGTAGTVERVGGFYDGALPALKARYEVYLAETDALLDDPSVRILDRILHDLDRLQRERAEFAVERPDLTLRQSDWPATVRDGLTGPDPFVAFRPAPPAAEPETIA
jgi:hypothetical protein